jgi:hypothetical protein
MVAAELMEAWLTRVAATRAAPRKERGMGKIAL